MKLEKREQFLLGSACILIGFLFVILVKTQVVVGKQQESQNAAVPSLIQTEQENQKLADENEKLILELEKYAQGKSASELANQQLQEAKANAGLVRVQGPGLRITLDDSKNVVPEGENGNLYVIHEEYIREIFNALWNGGAEAIAVNGQRVTTYTEVFCSGSYIQINGTRQMAPYVIEAVGDTDTLKLALNFYGWFRLGDLQEQNGITRKLETLNEIVIPKGKLRAYYHAEPVKEGG